MASSQFDDRTAFFRRNHNHTPVTISTAPPTSRSLNCHTDDVSAEPPRSLGTLRNSTVNTVRPVTQPAANASPAARGAR